MKGKRINTKIVFYVVVLLIVVIGSMISFTYAFSNETEKNFITSLTEEEAIYRILDNVADNEVAAVTEEYAMPVLEIKPPKVEIAEKNEKEDPKKVVPNNESGKTVTATEAIARYENNETSMGIDVSTWNGNIDWKKVKESGISFAMIRIGFRGYGTGKILMDNTFYQNIQGALANNINVGVYFFTAALNEAEAQEEAAWVLSVIKDYDISYPIVNDVELFGNSDTRLAGLSDHQITNNALAFSNYIRAHGYTPMIYSYLNALNTRLEVGRFGDTRVWLAHYAEATNYTGKYHMWQYTDSGSVPGISGKVDMNVSYFSVTNDISKKQEVNGINNDANEITVFFKDVNVKATIKQEVFLRITPSLTTPNKAGVIEAGEVVTITGISDSFVRINYNDNVYYLDSISYLELDTPVWIKDNVNLNVVLTKDEKLLNEPYEFLSNNVKEEIFAGSKVTLLAYNNEYLKISYNDSLLYIHDKNCYHYSN